MKPKRQERHTCPRRAEMPPSSKYAQGGEDQDRWSSGHGLVGQRRGCSFCGSMHPDDFLDLVEGGAVVGPTDKDYKAYLDGAEERGKFYFQHLDTEERRDRFCQLFNDRAMRIGYPGRFYVKPYFVKAVSRGEAH